MQGRKPKPSHERNGHRPDPHPVPLGGRPMVADLAEPPPELPEEGKELWRRDVQSLIDVALVDRVDRGALEALCTAYARAKQASRVVEADGLFIEGSRGQPQQHPAYRMEAESWDRYLRLAEQYGMTPISRIRMGLAELGRRSLAVELNEKLGPMHLEVVDGTAEE